VASTQSASILADSVFAASFVMHGFVGEIISTSSTVLHKAHKLNIPLASYK
jgi:hypothetical protein